MTLHAVDAVDDAVEATRRFLFPFSLVRWTKLALLVVLMGGGVSTNVSLPPVPNAESAALEGVPDALSGVDTGVIVAVAAVGVLLAMLLSVASLSLRLVFYDALRTNRVRLWEPFRRRLRQALGLFGFSFAVGIVLGGPFALAAVASERSLVRFEALPTVGLVGLALGAAVLVVVLLLVLRLTYEFVVPVMVVRDDGVLAAWRRFWSTLRDSWSGVVVYLVVHFFLALGVSIAETVVFILVGGTVVILAAVVLLVVGGVLGGLGALTGTTVGIAVLAVVTLVALTTLLVLLLPVRLVTRTYLIAYEVSTLGGMDRELALLAPSIDPSSASSTGDGDRPGPGRSDDRGSGGREGSDTTRDAGAGTDRDVGGDTDRDVGGDTDRDVGAGPERDANTDTERDEDGPTE